MPDADTFTADERLRAECARSRGDLPPKRRVVSTVSPTVSFSTPVAAF